jgi:hypothetical protein
MQVEEDFLACRELEKLPSSIALHSGAAPL